MFSPITFIDMVQTGKKWIVGNYIEDHDIRETWYAYIEKQTEFVKQVVKTNEVMLRKMKIPKI